MDALRTDLEGVSRLTEALEALNERLYEAREPYSDFFHLSPEAYVVVDCFGNVMDANPAAEALLGPVRNRPAASFVQGTARREFNKSLTARTSSFTTVLKSGQAATVRSRTLPGGGATLAVCPA